MKKSEKKRNKQKNRLEFRFALFRFEVKQKILSEKSKKMRKKWKKAKKSKK